MSKHSRKTGAKRQGYPTTRASFKPFCAYYGPRGETCLVTRDLKTVWELPTVPPVRYLACPLHYEEVRQYVEVFLARCCMAPQTITFPMPQERNVGFPDQGKERRFDA